MTASSLELIQRMAMPWPLTLRDVHSEALSGKHSHRLLPGASEVIGSLPDPSETFPQAIPADCCTH